MSPAGGVIETLDAVPESGAAAGRANPSGPLAPVSSFLTGVTRAVSATTLLALVVVMFVGVFYRYVLNNALAWTGEVAGLATGWVVFLAASTLLAKGGHPAITAFLRPLSVAQPRWAGALREVCVGVYLLLLFVAGLAVTLSPGAPQTSSLHLTYALLYAAIPVAAVIMLVHWGARLRNSVDRLTLPVLGVAGVAAAFLWWLTQGAPAPLYAVPLVLLWLSLPVMFALGVPIAVVLGLFSMTVLSFTGTVPLSILAERLYAGIDEPSFLAIPALILTGALMLRTGMSTKLVAFASSLVGRVRGGLAISNVIASVLFADISGSAVADTAAIGSVMMPEMKKRGYEPGFVVAHQAASGAMGTLFPPSISMIIYATVTSVSVTTLFLSSLVPGVITAVLFMCLAYVLARRFNYPREAAITPRELGRAWAGAIPATGAIALVLGGILGGVFTPPEAGATAAAYVFVVSLFGGVRRSFQAFRMALIEAAETTAMVMFIIANAAVMAWLMISFQIPQTVVASIESLTTNRTVVTLLICLVLIILAIFLEPPAILIAVVPIVLPLVTALGGDPVHFGVVVMLTTTIGMIIPPIGITLLVAAGILNVRLEVAARAALQHVALVAATLLLVVLAPGVTAILTGLLS